MTNVMDIDHAPFGRLQYGKEYGAEYWRGSVTLPGFVQPFSLTVRAGRSGPSVRQTAAMIAVEADASLLLEQATQPMIELHREAGLPSPGGDKNVWSILQPEEIEVSDETYYQDGRIFLALIFSSTVEPDFAPAIETADGRFLQVVSGT